MTVVFPKSSFPPTLVPGATRMPVPDDRRNHRLDLARQWRASGRSARAFAQEQGVTPWMLYYWRGRVPKEEGPKARRERRSSSPGQPAAPPLGAGGGGGGGEV